jgi:hypothetical protein
MSDDHKSALAQGRREGRIVRDYLDALRASKDRRGRRRTAESITRRLTAIEEELGPAAPIDRLRLLQERYDLLAALGSRDVNSDVTSFEDAFIDVAASYSERHGIAYASWREVGVPAAVLKRAHISR